MYVRVSDEVRMWQTVSTEFDKEADRGFTSYLQYDRRVAPNLYVIDTSSQVLTNILVDHKDR